ncbi:tail fiber assembly protein [Escherichia coli]|uniref:Tail fiber assembly protein n=1 Tax=Escherichia coli TaxID=562 RepID=A0AAX2KL78_ECOLX|nr:tail fiber assembly protein [Escherichia coli]
MLSGYIQKTVKTGYEEVNNFQDDTIKIVYDENNIIAAITKDASTLNPEGFSVVEVPDITANRRADDSGKWMFKDGAVIKRIYTADEQQQQAESQKAALISEAESVIQPLETRCQAEYGNRRGTHTTGSMGTLQRSGQPCGYGKS